MVTGTHPEDVELFEYVEGELPAPRRAELEAHLATCARCAEHIMLAQAGRDALRRSELLELPASRREAILRSLPAQPRAVGHRSWTSPRRLVAILAPAAAVAAVVAAIVTTGDFSGGVGSGGGGGAVTASREAAQTGAAGGAADSSVPLFAAGPADQVVTELRAKGFDARVVGKHVEVRDATRAEVERALSRHRTGRVKIVIVP